jgi:hypothetical protein
MLNKKGISPLILEIIGGVIVVAIVIVLFAGFASPYLEFLSDSKNVEAFNKFTTAMSKSCKEGSETVPYFSLGYKSTNEIYAIGLVDSKVSDAIKNLHKCAGIDDTNCYTGGSKDVISNCVADGYCWCLFKIKFLQGQTSYCGNSSFNGLAVDSSDIKNIDGWDTSFSNEISGYYMSKVGVLLCSNIEKDLNCNTTDAYGKQIPVLPIVGSQNGGYLVWMQSDIYVDESWIGGGLKARDLSLDSISFDRPISYNQLSDTAIFTSNPSMRINNTAKADVNNIQIRGTDCS